MISALEALERLHEGNRRFASDVRGSAHTRRLRRGGASSQKARNRSPSFSDAPTRGYRQRSSSTKAWAISSSSALPETSSRPLKSAAWNSPQNGSAHRSLWCLGHSRCGAVLATLEELMRPREKQSRNLRSIVDRIRPSVEGLLATELRHDSETLVRHAVRANIRASANQLRHGSEVLEELIEKDVSWSWAPNIPWRPGSLISSTGSRRPASGQIEGALKRALPTPVAARTRVE